MLLADAVNQLLNGESDLHDRFVRREVESIVEAIDCVGHDETPRHRAVLRLADALTERVLLQTTLTEYIVARVHGRHQVTQVGVVVDGNHGRHGDLDSRVSLLGGGDLLKPITVMVLSEETPIHNTIVLN